MLRTMRESEVFKDEFEHLREGVRTELLPRLDDVRRECAIERRREYTTQPTCLGERSPCCNTPVALPLTTF